MSNKIKVSSILFGLLVVTVCLYYLSGTIQYKNLADANVDQAKQNMQSQIPKPEDRQYAVSAGHPLAVKVGMDVLSRGGNAVDAAIAVSYALGVVQPFASGVGGGGVMLIYPPDKQKPVVYDYESISSSSGAITERYVGIPGFVRAMEKVHTDYGTMDMPQLIEPAAKIAEEGFKVDKVLNNVLTNQRYKLTDKTILSEFFPQGRPLKVGTLLKQPVLADTLREIASDGARAFYQGSIAESIQNDVLGMSKKDLNNYQVLKKEPVMGKYRGYDVFSAPPPYSGITLLQILELSEKMNIDNLDASQDNIYLYSNIINEAYSKRSKDLADPAYMRVDYHTLLDQPYIDTMLKDISSHDLGQDEINGEETEETTHFVVVDKNGLMVSCTNSLSSWFGSGIYTRGFFLNNHLTNLNQIKGSVNNWTAGKHPRSFISPTIVAKDGKAILGIGTPGGRKIPMMISQVLFKILRGKESPQQAIDEPRFYIMQNGIYSESGLLDDGKKKVLGSKGYQVYDNISGLSFGAINCLQLDVATNRIYGGADKRRGGGWELGVAAN